MHLKKILENAFSTQFKEYEHHTSDYVYLLGSVSGIMCITLGLTMALFSSAVSAFVPFIVLGFIWFFFGVMTLAGVYFFQTGKKKQGAFIMISSGLMGMPFGVGFFLGSALAVFSGALALKVVLDKGKRKK